MEDFITPSLGEDRCMGLTVTFTVQAVLICGWQDTPFMLELLTDLDRGVDKLPRGSEVILLNMHNTEEISKHVKRLGRWSNIAVRHIKGNPLHIDDIKKASGDVPRACVLTSDFAATWHVLLHALVVQIRPPVAPV